MAVGGVANVAIWGQRDRQIQVHVDPERLQANNVTLDQVLTASRDATAVTAGGFIDMPNQRMAISHVSPVRSANDLAAMPLVHRDGALLRIGDVATVTEGTPPPIGDAVIDTGDGLMLIVEKQPGANTLELTRGVEEALNALKPAMPDVTVNSRIFRPATFIEMSLHNLGLSMLFGAMFVIAVLIAFLYEWRSALITIVAMPLSLMAAAWMLTLNGRTIDTMGLAGLIIALGVVVDDAIIDVENIARRLRLNAAAAKAAVGNARGARGVDGGPERGRLRQPDRHRGLHSDFHAARAVGIVLPAAGNCVRPRDPGIAVCRAHSDAGARAHAAAGRPPARRPAGRSLAEGAVSLDPADDDGEAETGRVDPDRHTRADGGRGSVPWRRISPELQGVGLPDALGREARHVIARHAPNYRRGREGAARRSRRS